VKNQGFSFYEVLITLVLLSLMALVSLFVVDKNLAKARDAKRKVDLQKIRQALIIYDNLVDHLPDVLPNCGQPFTLGNNTLIPSFPCDPKGFAYFYQIEENSFKLYANLENLDDPSISIVGCDGGCGPDCQYNYGTSSTNTYIDRCLPPDVIYACSPGLNHRDRYNDPAISLCPKIFLNDPTCQNQCGQPQNRCKNSSGKHVPQ